MTAITTVVDFIGSMVAKTDVCLKKHTSLEVFYQYGHVNEIEAILRSYSETEDFRKQKYPAIFLLTDFLERKGGNPDYETEAMLQLLIVAASGKDYRTAERYEKVFKPVLYPIYEVFMKQLKNDSRVVTKQYGELPHTKIDRSLVSGFQLKTQGGKTGNLFSDHLDAIEVNNLNLVIKKTC
jgi:hypothetical protein